MVKKVLWVALAAALSSQLVACAETNTGPLVPAVNETPSAAAIKAAAPLVPTVPASNPRMRITKIDLKPAKLLQGEAAIKAANKSAQQQPNSSEYINSIMNFDYQPGALYQIFSAPLNVTDLQFEPGEKIVSVAAGDTLRWQLSKTYSGSGSDKVEHIVLKPIAAGLTNSLVVTTDRRTYHMLLRSTQQTAMASVKWRYPGDGGIVESFGSDISGGASAADLAIDTNHLDMGYSTELVSGSVKPTWYPKAVFNDGKKTYIQFPTAMQHAPTLFVGTGKNNQIVNYRVVGNYYVVDQIIQNAQLRMGTSVDDTSQWPEVVQITYNG